MAGGLSSIALAVPCIGAGSFSNKIPKNELGRSRPNELGRFDITVFLTKSRFQNQSDVTYFTKALGTNVKFLSNLLYLIDNGTILLYTVY